MSRIYRFLSEELWEQSRQANRIAQRGREICGLLVRNGSEVRLIPVQNSTTESGSFEMRPNWWYIALRASGIAANRVIGTYHSHPLSSAEPGASDIANARNGDLMLIFAVWDKQVRLWQIRDGRACSATLVRR